jgi:hypothetical protein
LVIRTLKLPAISRSVAAGVLGALLSPPVVANAGDAESSAAGKPVSIRLAMDMSAVSNEELVAR